MTKNEFLRGVIEAFLATHSAWRLVVERPRQYHFVVARELPGVLVYLDFAARPDNDVFGQGVGWAPSLARLLEMTGKGGGTQSRRIDGYLARLGRLEHPRNFEHDELRISTFSLCRPMDDYRLSIKTHDQIRTQMLMEIDEYALPYLCMMLKFRHNLALTPEQLGSAEVG